MKKLAAITLTSMMLLLATAMVVGAVDIVEIRGGVATGNFEWTAQNFAGFYYDIDDDLGTEKITTTITEGKQAPGTHWRILHHNRPEERLRLRRLGILQRYRIPG